MTEKDDESAEMRERGLSPRETVTKDEADYGRGTPFARCGKCEYFERGNRCKIVEGEIEPYGWCKYFENPDSPRDMAHLAKSKMMKKPMRREDQDAA